MISEKGRIDVLLEGTKPGDIIGEHSLVLCRPRNTTAVCVSDRCIAHEMKAALYLYKDFYETYNSHRLASKY